jgi:hypothetical protein
MISGLDVARFSKTNIFSAIIIIFFFLRKSNIVSIGILIASAGGYLNTYAVYAKSKFDLFYMFTSTLKDYNRKKRKP